MTSKRGFHSQSYRVSAYPVFPTRFILIKIFIISALEKTSAEDDKLEVDDNNAQTIRPSRSPVNPGKNVPLPVAKAPSPSISPIVEDYSDLAFDEDDDKLQEKVADFKVHSPRPMNLMTLWTKYLHQLKNSFRRGLFHPDDIKTIGLAPASPGPKTAPLPALTRRKSRPSLNHISSSPGPSSGHARTSSYTGPTNGSYGRSEARRLHSQPEFGKYAEDEDDEDYDDIFGKPPSGTSTSMVSGNRMLILNSLGRQAPNPCKHYSSIPACQTNHGYVGGGCHDLRTDSRVK